MTALAYVEPDSVPAFNRNQRMTVLKAPFPAFGGKSRIAPSVWKRLGDVRNYVEPFCFSAAMLLKRPEPGPIETINDRNAFVSNFWRAVRADPDAVAHHADWPVNETDLHARHRWLVGSDKAAACLQAVRDDADAFDARIAGWWCWGACCWIGSGWCDETQQLPHIAGARGLTQQLPQIGGDAGASGSGVVASAGHTKPNDRQPALAQGGWGLNAGHAKRPRVPNSTGGAMPGVVNATPFTDDTHRPQLADAFSRGRGVNGNDAASVCDERSAWIRGWMRQLSDRLRPVRVCCGHWSRVCDSPSTMTRLGTTGVFLDPPYRKTLKCGTVNRTAHIYASDKVQDIDALCDEVQAWCLRWGKDKDVRIALCGLEGEYPEIEAAGWEVEAWKSNGGYGNQSGEVNENAARERVWYSPHCEREDGGLFA